MEIRILLLFFLLIILTADIIAFSKGRGSRRSSGGSRVSSGGSRSFAGGSRVSSRSSRVSSGGSRGFSGGSSSRGSPSHIRSNSRHKSSSSWRKIGSSPTRTLSSEHEYDQTMHHQNKDTSTSISPAKRRGARPFARSFGQSSASYSNAVKVLFGFLLMLPSLFLMLNGSQFNCDYYQYLDEEQTYYVFNPEYPSYYMGERYCTWDMESLYVITINCTDFNINEQSRLSVQFASGDIYDCYSDSNCLGLTFSGKNPIITLYSEYPSKGLFLCKVETSKIKTAK